MVDLPVNLNKFDRIIKRPIASDHIETKFNCTRHPVSDGGFPTSAGITPVDASHLSSFLDDYGDNSVFELTLTSGEDKESDLLWNISVNADEVDQSSDTPTAVCTPLDPGSDQYHVDIDEIKILSVIDPPAEVFTETTETPTEEAIALRRLARAKPGTVRVSSLLSLIERAEAKSRQRREALKALRFVASVRPNECKPAIPILQSLLENEDLGPSEDALATLGAIGNDNPKDIAPMTDVIIPYLGSDRNGAREEAAKCLAAVTREHPSDGLDAVSSLGMIIRESAAGQKPAVIALERIAKESPEAVSPVVDQLADVLADESISDNIRMSATAAVGRVVSESPDVAVDIIDDVIRLIEADSFKLRNNAIALIYEMAAIHTDVIEPYVDDIAALLTAEDTKTRINASGAVARVAEDFPDSVKHMSADIIDLLSDDNSDVRLNACWTLGYLRATEAQNPLNERKREDNDQNVRTRAQWALSRIESE